MSEIVLLLDNGSKAVVSTTGASILELSLERQQISIKPKHARKIFAGAVLAPWQNRLAKGHWTNLSEELQILPVNETELGNALHGLVLDLEFAILEQSASIVVLGTQIIAADGYEFDVDLIIKYSLDEFGFSCGFRALNLGVEPAPFIIGFHPYFCIGNPDSSFLTVPAASYYTQNERKIPQDKVSTSGTHFDFTSGKGLANLEIDDFFTDLRVDGSEIVSILRTANWTINLSQSPNLKHLVIYLTSNYETEEGAVFAVALEPATGPANGLSSKQDLTWLEPEKPFTGSWRVSLAAE